MNDCFIRVARHKQHLQVRDKKGRIAALCRDKITHYPAAIFFVRWIQMGRSHEYLANHLWRAGSGLDCS